MYQTFSTASTTFHMYFKFYIVVDKCIFYRIVILVFLFLNGVEVQQTLKSKFACTSATFCHMVSRRLSVYGLPSNCLLKYHLASNSKLESCHSSVTLGCLNIRLLSTAQSQRFHASVNWEVFRAVKDRSLTALTTLNTFRRLSRFTDVVPNLPWIVSVTCANTPALQNSMRTMRSVRSCCPSYVHIMSSPNFGPPHEHTLS
jgi:hypothetical protein